MFFKIKEKAGIMSMNTMNKIKINRTNYMGK